MPDDFPRDRFEKLVGASIRELKSRRTQRWAMAGIYGLCAALAAWIILTLAWPALLGNSAVLIGLLFVVFAGVVVFAWLSPVTRAAAVAKIDRDRGLPDSAVSAAELDGAPSAGRWREQQLIDTLARIDSRPARKTAAATWPVIFGIASALVLSTLILTRSAAAHAASRPAAPDPMLAQHGADLEKLFADWDQAEKEQPDPELAKLLREIQPLREKIAAGKLDQREMLLQLSKVEDRLAAMQQKMERESLDPHADELAEAMSGVEGLEPLAAALRNKDYARARDAADKFGDKLNQPEAKTPAGAEQAASRMEQAAQKMSDAGQKDMAQGMQSLSQGAQKKDPSKMAEGARKISQGMAQQKAGQSQCQGLALQRQQIGMCKECMGNGEGLNAGLSLLPKLTFQKSKKPGKGAGSATNLNREGGAETESLGAGNRENLTGNTNGMGESETETVRTSEAPGQQTVSAAAADFAQYRKLSEEAIEDESLPVAHRLTIRRYFESIRPSSADQPQ